MEDYSSTTTNGGMLYHEVQEPKLSAVHCVNTVLQGPFFSEFDFAVLASDLDHKEHQMMMFPTLGGETLFQESHRVSLVGDFTIQVLEKALEVWDLQVTPLYSLVAELAHIVPEQEQAYVFPEQERAHVVPEQEQTHIMPEQGHAQIVPEQRQAHVVPEQEHAHVVPDQEQPEQEEAHVVPDLERDHVAPEQERDHVVPEQERDHVVPEQGHDHVVPEQGHVHVVPEQGHDHIMPEQGQAHVVPEPELVHIVPEQEQAFICHLQDHWFCIRKVNGEWYNFDSLFVAPHHLSKFYLAAYLDSLKGIGWSIFLVRGNFPKECPFLSLEARNGYGQWLSPEDAELIIKSCTTPHLSREKVSQSEDNVLINMEGNDFDAASTTSDSVFGPSLPGSDSVPIQDKTDEEINSEPRD